MDKSIHSNEIHAEPESRSELPMNWLRLLFCFHAASLAVSVISNLLSNDDWLSWVSRVIMAGIIICLFQLSPANLRYRRSAILGAVRLILTLIILLVLSPAYARLMVLNPESANLLSPVITILNAAELVLHYLATYQEYHGHADMTAEADPRLSKNWLSLYIWALIFVVLSTVASLMVIRLFEMAEITAAAVNIFNRIMLVIEKILELLYLWYLYRMIRLFQN